MLYKFIWYGEHNDIMVIWFEMINDYSNISKCCENNLVSFEEEIIFTVGFWNLYNIIEFNDYYRFFVVVFHHNNNYDIEFDMIKMSVSIHWCRWIIIGTNAAVANILFTMNCSPKVRRTIETVVGCKTWVCFSRAQL